MEDVVANLGCGCSFLASSSSSVALWSITKKKPLVSQPHHQGPLAGAPASSLEESWVTSVSAYTSTDLVASGKGTAVFSSLALFPGSFPGSTSLVSRLH